MTRPSRLFALLLATVVAALPVQAGPEVGSDALRLASLSSAGNGVPGMAPRPRARERADQRCTENGRHCIALASYVPDVCRTIEAVAGEAGLDPHFLARLVWRESLFDAGAVSPAGAQGIAQFMPETAELRGLGDPFNPASALEASARYLAELTRTFGNVGLAAVAYNGGEARAERFIDRAGGLPDETRHYVAAITGHSAETWRDAPPAELDVALAKESAFRPACIELASARRLKEFPAGVPTMPWGVVIGSHVEREGAERIASRVRNRFREVLGGDDFTYARGRRAGMVRPMVMAQIGRSSRAEADALCARLRGAGGDCLVLKN